MTGWPGRGTRRSTLIAGVMVVAGFLVAVTALSEQGLPLRSERIDAVALVQTEQQDIIRKENQARELSDEVTSLTDLVAQDSKSIGALAQRSRANAAAAGMSSVRGATVTVTLDDSPHTEMAGAQPDDLVVHQQDVQAVMNALWAGGAKAMTVMGQRVISTSGVRCVGNTLILHGQVYSPPFTIVAVGNPASLERSLSNSPDVKTYLAYARKYALGWNVQRTGDKTLPAYSGTTQLQYAKPISADAAKVL